MPTELRQIVFENAELRKALSQHFVDQPDRLPPGAIEAVGISQDELEIELQLAGQTSAASAPTVIPAEHVAAALIAYCRANTIPLPRDAKKYLVVSGDNLALRIVLSAERVIEIIEDDAT
jgi:hypothetical protein